MKSSGASSDTRPARSSTWAVGMGMGGTPTQQHIHTTIRTPNGGDYGVDLLKLHLETDH
ncbi:hypothetical protein SUDANB145_01159 [Streptomyces sp. enrichment culture]